MPEKSLYRIYIDTSDRKNTRVVLSLCEKSSPNETVVEEVTGELDVSSTVDRILKKHKLKYEDISVYDYMKTSGSFTGLRVGAAITNMYNWILGKKDAGHLDYPEYDREPNITPPKKFKLN
jgi:tRNA A37 threonylcarbamoyladenosine modification protein TsaB